MEYTQEKYAALQAEYNDIENQIEILKKKRDSIRQELNDFSVHTTNAGNKYNDADLIIKTIFKNSSTQDIIEYVKTLKPKEKYISLLYIVDSSTEDNFAPYRKEFKEEYDLLFKYFFDVDSVLAYLNEPAS